jgi:hypothetical protein
MHAVDATIIRYLRRVADDFSLMSGLMNTRSRDPSDPLFLHPKVAPQYVSCGADSLISVQNGLLMLSAELLPQRALTEYALSSMISLSLLLSQPSSDTLANYFSTHQLHLKALFTAASTCESGPVSIVTNSNFGSIRPMISKVVKRVSNRTRFLAVSLERVLPSSTSFHRDDMQKEKQVAP